MPFAVVLYLDDPASRAIERAQAAVVEAGLSPDTHVLDFQPHITLGICDRLDVAGFEPYLRDFAAATPALDVCFASLATFAQEPKVLFLAPDNSSDLLAMHRRFYPLFERFATGPWGYYVPGKWVPHCTVADGLRPEDVARALNRCGMLRLPLCSRVDEVATVEFYPTTSHYSFKLSAVSN